MKERRKSERRSKTLIRKNFQNKFLKLIIISLISSLILSMATFYIALMIQVERAAFAAFTEKKLAELFVWMNWALPVIAVILIVVAVIVAKHISFKIAGPLYALEKQLHMVVEDKIDKIQLRGEDNEMIPLANILNELIEKKMTKG